MKVGASTAATGSPGVGRTKACVHTDTHKQAHKYTAIQTLPTNSTYLSFFVLKLTPQFQALGSEIFGAIFTHKQHITRNSKLLTA